MYFDVLRTQWEAKDQGWVLQTQSDPILGKRFAHLDDDSIILIFDEAGYIAGTQSVIRLHNTDTTVMQYNPAYMVRKTFIISCFLLFKTQLDSWFDEEVYVTTMYFVDPDIINSGGRTPEMFEAQGTGDRLVMRVSVAK